MKKILLTFFVFLCFAGAFLFPLVVGLHASLSEHHGMSATECLEHCVSGEVFLNTPISISNFTISEVIFQKIIFLKVFEFILPLVLLYISLTHAPPNLLRSLKNYSYANLVGVIKLTT